MKLECFEVGPLANNVYLVGNEASREAAVVDPGMESEPVLARVRRDGWQVRYVINTHGHFDHAFLDAEFLRETGATLLIHAADAPMLDDIPTQASWFGLPAPVVPVPGKLLQDGDRIPLGDEELVVLHTPGHSPGGICLLQADPPADGGPRLLISGDTLFAGSIGRTDLPGGSHEQLLRSIRERILVLPEETRVYPGHGPATTIGEEKAHNPFLVGG